MKKPVIRSPLDLMPTHQKQSLMAWLTTGGKDGIGISYEAAQQRFLAEFGVKVSLRGLHSFYHRNRKLQTISPGVNFDPGSNTLTIVIKLFP